MDQLMNVILAYNTTDVPGFIQCNLDKESRLTIYRSYILSNFNYSPLVWHFCPNLDIC